MSKLEEEQLVDLMKVPPGYTYVCQPADVAWNRPLKEAIRKQWVEFLLQQVQDAGPGVPFKMTPPSRRDEVSWIRAAWESLSHDIIVNGFMKAKPTHPRTNSMAIARLLSPSMPPSEPDWGSLIRRLQDSSIPSVSINPAFDIEHSELDNSASDAIHDAGFEADDEGEA
uniref:DDE-1 domain-containing protein n=1 Tax=Phytophthora ramorum TaxID=164328 RepID=H3GSL2_PHYRM